MHALCLSELRREVLEQVRRGRSCAHVLMYPLLPAGNDQTKELPD